MECYQCGEEAVGRCYNCGSLFCAEHGDMNCERCETSIAPGDRRADRISAQSLATSVKHGWWRPQPAEEFEPPACYQCKGLARNTCRHCQSKYCSEHAGAGGLCLQCWRSSSLGLWLLLGILLLIVVVIALGYIRQV